MATDDLTTKLKELKEQLKSIGIATTEVEKLATALKSAEINTDGVTKAAAALKEIFEESNNLISSNIGLDDESLDRKREALQAVKTALSYAKLHGTLTKTELEQQETLVKELERGVRAEQKRSIAMQKSLDKLIGMKGEAIGLGSHLDAISHIWNKMSKEEALERVISKAANGMAKFSKAIITATFELDKTQAKVAKATSMTNYAQPMEELRQSALAAGVSVEEMGENFIALNNNYSNFNKLNSQAITELAQTANSLSAVGFSAEAFSKSLDIGVKSLGMSEQQVQTFNKELVNFGKAAGVSMDRLSRDLISVGPKLVTFGSQGTRVFKEMSLASKNLGIEMDRLFSITEQYTTFEGAAGAAAKLNSMLGGNFINSLDLMNASLDNPVETFRLLKDSMDASGKSFDDMTPAMKKAIAEAAGFSDVNEAARIFAMDVNEGTESLEEQAATQEELNKMSRNFMEVQEKINKLLAQMTPVLKPITDFLGKMIDGLAKVVEKYPGIFEFLGWATLFITALGAIAMGVLIFAANFILLGKAFQAIRSPIQFIGSFFKNTEEEINKADKTSKKSGKSMAQTIKQLSAAVKDSWREILAFGAAVFLIGGGIALASLGLAELVKAFSALTGEQILGALGALVIVMGGFAIMLNVLAAAALPAIGPMYAIGGAIALIGLGIGIAAFGMGYLVSSFKDLSGPQLIAAGVAIAAIAAGIWFLVPALAALANPISAAGAGILWAVGGAIALIGLGIGLAAAGIGYLISQIPAAATGLENFNKQMKDFVNPADMIGGLAQIALAFLEIADAIEKINSEKLALLSNVNSNLGTANVQVSGVTSVIPSIDVQDIIVKNTIKYENPENNKQSAPINIELVVPIKVDGNALKDNIISIAKDEIQKNNDNQSAINLRVR